MPVSTNVEAQQHNYTSHTDQQSDQTQATYTFTWIKAHREQGNQEWIGGDEQAGKRRRNVLFAVTDQ